MLSDRSTDLRLIAPVSTLTRPVNRLLMTLGRGMLRYPWATLGVVGFIYLIGLVLINVPMLNIDRDIKILVVMAPLMLPIWLALGYLASGLVLLALFARHPGTRLGCALLLYVLVLGPALIMVCSDTATLLTLGDSASLALIVANMIAIPWLGFRYQQHLIRHARWSPAALSLLIALIGFEGGAALSTRQIDTEQITFANCRSERPINGQGVRGPAIRLCDARVNDGAHIYHFKDMPLPDGKPRYLEIRQALLRHFRLY